MTIHARDGSVDCREPSGRSRFVSLSLSRSRRLLPLILLVVPLAGDSLDWVSAGGDVPSQAGDSALFGERRRKRIVDETLAEEPQPQGNRQPDQNAASPKLVNAVLTVLEFLEGLAERSSVERLFLIHGKRLPISLLLLAQSRNTRCIGGLPSDGGIWKVFPVEVILPAAGAPSNNFAIADFRVCEFPGGSGVSQRHVATRLRGGG